jgi:uncharacterized membrane-anchored protein
MRTTSTLLTMLLLLFGSQEAALAKPSATKARPRAAERKERDPAEPDADAAVDADAFRARVRARLPPERQAAFDAMTTEAIDALLSRLQAGDDAGVDDAQKEIVGAVWAERFDAGLTYATGDVPIGDGLATLHLGPGFRYLDPAQSHRLLEEAWGNPPSPDTLGVIVPTSVSPTEEGGWAVIVTYAEEGHVADDDADEIDYDELLAAMKADTEEENAARRAQGFGAIHLIGWAEPPRYREESRRLYWARELDFEGSPAHTLNYSIRVLGRRGVLELNAVARIDQLAAIKPQMEDLLPQVEFATGHRYEDFDPDVDKVAAYGLGALVAGKVLAKTGLLAGLLKILIAAKKAIVLAVVGLGALVARLFKRRDAA